MAAPLSEAPADTRPVFIILLPLMMAVFVAFLVIGVAMPVLPLHVHSGLHLSTFMVGLVAGAQFVAALASRLWSGHVADTRGAKPAVLAGLLAAAVAGLLYWISLPFVDTPFVSVAILLLGRAVLGGAESFIITGATIWGLARVGPAHAGKVIAWMGTAMFAAFAGGAPIGTILYEKEGFGAIAIATLAAPLATMFLMARLQSVAPPPRNGKPHFLTVIGQIWRPGLGAALSSIGFGTVAAFASLLFVERSWSPVWLAFTAYAGALILARLIFGQLPDRLGGARVALFFIVVETMGLALMWLAWSGPVAALGAALTGFGYALVYPGFGVEAVSEASEEARGVAMAAYTACLDVALGVSGPVLGLVASVSGLPVVFLVSAVAVLCSAIVALLILRQKAARPA